MFAVVGASACVIPSSTRTLTAMSNKQRLVLSVIDFLNQSIQDGTVKQDDKESLEVASASRGFSPARNARVLTDMPPVLVQSNVSAKHLASTPPTTRRSTASPSSPRTSSPSLTSS